MGAIAYADSIEDVDVIPTGLFIDKLTGIGGIPRGVITEIFGDESIGKSSLCLQLVASAQKQGLRCLWVDIERSFIPAYATHLGVDNSKLGIIREHFAESAIDLLEESADNGEWDLIVFDSIGAILPRSIAEKGADGKTMGAQSRLISDFCKRIIPIIATHNIALVAINHSFIDIMSGKLLTSGGKKLRYYKSLSLRLKQKQGVSVKQGERKVGKVVIGIVQKNKMSGTEGLEIEGTLIIGTGFSAGADLLNDALEKEVISKRGNTYYFGEVKLALGLGKTRTLVEGDEQLQEKIKVALHEKMPKV
jgi:recombination protein RecA